MMIPSTEGMRNVYASVQALGIRSGPPGAIEYNHGKAKFDAWLAAIEREAAAKALEDAASSPIPREALTNGTRPWLRARAAEYKKETKRP